MHYRNLNMNGLLIWIWFTKQFEEDNQINHESTSEPNFVFAAAKNSLSFPESIS